jgi:hypothetical protein
MRKRRRRKRMVNLLAMKSLAPMKGLEEKQQQAKYSSGPFGGWR